MDHSVEAGYLDEATTQLDRVATIARQTLSFSRRSGGPSVCQPADLLRGVLHLLRPKINSTGTRVLEEIRTDRPVPCVPGELQQVLTNIINNAIEAMGREGTLIVRVSNASRWDDAQAEGVRISIGDTGPGMSAKVLRRMREPFFTTKADTGTGLGMWVAYELVERHGGKLLVRTATSADRHGTVFSLFLPARSEVLPAALAQGT